MKNTDTHYRLQNGEGSFNYRILFNASVNPNKNEEMILNLQAKDVDLLSKNDYIGSTALNLSEPIKACILTGRKVSINKSYYQTFLEKHMGEHKLKFENNESFWIDLIDG